MIKFKHEIDRLLFPYLAPNLIRAAGEMCDWCHSKGMDFVITETISTIERDKKRGIHRVSQSHLTGRAFDLRIKNWNKVQRENFCDWFNVRLEPIAARTYGGQRIIAVLKDDHIHVQVNHIYSCKWSKSDIKHINLMLSVD